MIIASNKFTKNLFNRGFYVSILLFSLTALGQENINEKKILRQARKELSKENYSKAQEKYVKLVNNSPKNSIYNFECGLSYYFSSFERGKSTPFFEAAIQYIEEDTIPEMYYYLAKSYQLNNEFEKSTSTFSKFDPYSIYGKKVGDELKEEINFETTYNRNGVKYESEKDNNIKITNIGNQINTLDREYAPVLNKNGDVLLFTSRRKINRNRLDRGDLLPYEDIYVAKKSDNGWVLLTDSKELEKYLPKNVNTKKHDASITYSTDEKTIYTYKKDAIWESNFDGSSWSDLKKLDKNVNASKFNVPSVSLAPNGDIAFFVAEKKEGVGGKDIYKSVKSENGDWSEPEILNTNINSIKDEDAPYLTNDGNVLYFSSRGHSSIGGYDIFKSELIDGNWSEPINLGIPINSPSDDIYYVIGNDDKTGFFSSSREGGNGDMDIYSYSYDCKNLENTEIRGIAYDNKTKLPLLSKLTLIRKSDNKEISSLSSNKDGTFMILAQPNQDYTLSIEAENFTKQTIYLTVPKQCDYYQQYSEIALEQILIDDKPKQIATIRNSFFDVKNEIEKYKKTSQLDTSSIRNQNSAIPVNDLEIIAYSRTIDENNTDLNFKTISDTINIENIKDELASGTNSNIPSFDNIYFDFDKSNLKPESKKELNKIIDFLKSTEGRDLTITVNGNTDGKRDMDLNRKIFAKRNLPFTIEASEERSKKYNHDLSKRRADNAVKYLVSKGISENKIVVNYNGENNPLAPNTNADGSDNPVNRTKNRRVSFSFSNNNVL